MSQTLNQTDPTYMRGQNLPETQPSTLKHTLWIEPEPSSTDSVLWRIGEVHMPRHASESKLEQPTLCLDLADAAGVACCWQFRVNESVQSVWTARADFDVRVLDWLFCSQSSPRVIHTGPSPAQHHVII